MTARLSRGSVFGYETVVLQNARVRAVIIPALGGRVWELEDLDRHRQWIWHREDVPLRAVPPGAAYDDVWAGGWEELFPNDAPCRFEERDLPDHGEWWTWAWRVTGASSDGAATVRLSAESKIVKASCEKTFTLDAESPALSVRYRIRSLETAPFHFLFKQHLPVAITPACRLALPGGLVQPVDPSFGTILTREAEMPWPAPPQAGGAATDLRTVLPASDASREFVYVRDLPEPWCGVDDVAQGASIRMAFDARHMPFVWLFLSYGGWRNVYTAVLEPCTNMPKDLAEAVRLGQSASLGPGQLFETAATVTLAGLGEAGS